jgi:hypothetical protein
MDFRDERLLVAMETPDHHRKESGGFEPLKHERMPCLISEQGKESHLRAAVAFAEGWMAFSVARK